MEEDRKYRQHGYMDAGRRTNGGFREERPKQTGPRPPIDVTGPRLPRLVQSVLATRCYNCSTALPAGSSFPATCPKCGVELHCCKQCAHFEPSTRFQCRKPVPVRIALKDQRNECTLFSPRLTVAREAPLAPVPAGAPSVPEANPRTPSDARAAFDNLFKK